MKKSIKFYAIFFAVWLGLVCVAVCVKGQEQSILVTPPQPRAQAQAYAYVPGLVGVPVQVVPRPVQKQRCCPQQKRCPCPQPPVCCPQPQPKPNFATPVRDCLWKCKQCAAHALWHSRYNRYKRLERLLGPQVMVVPQYGPRLPQDLQPAVQPEPAPTPAEPQ